MLFKVLVTLIYSVLSIILKIFMYDELLDLINIKNSSTWEKILKYFKYMNIRL